MKNGEGIKRKPSKGLTEALHPSLVVCFGSTSPSACLLWAFLMHVHFIVGSLLKFLFQLLSFAVKLDVAFAGLSLRCTGLRNSLDNGKTVRISSVIGKN